MKFDSVTRTTGLSVILIAVMLLGSTLLGLGGLFNIQTFLDQWRFYVPFGGIVLLTIVQLFTLQRNIVHTSKYGTGLGFSMPGEKPSFSVFKRFSNPQLFLLSLVIIGFVGMAVFLKYPQVMFTEIPKQQFTKFDSLIFSSILIPIAENAGLSLLIMLTYFGLRILAINKNWSPETFSTFSWAVIPLGGLYGLLSHVMAYGTQNQALGIVFIYWSLFALLIHITGSFIPAWIAHLVNNLFLSLKTFGTSDLTYVAIGIFLALCLVAYIWKYGFIPKRREVSAPE